MHMLTIPPKVKAQLHETYATAIYVISGEGGMYYGKTLEEHTLAQAGDYMYIPAGVQHLPYSSSDSVDCGCLSAY